MLYYCTNTHTPNANPRTLFQAYIAAGQRLKIYQLDISLQGSTPATAPVLMDWIIQTTAGTASSLTAQKQDRGIGETIQGSFTKDFTAEPTAGATLIPFSLHQQATWPQRMPFEIIVKGDERVGLRYRSSTYVPVTYTVYVEE